jgi:Holliday junction resolvase RusA-like endonuclease
MIPEALQCGGNWAQFPCPPSANRLWRISRNRQHRSKDYTDWLNIVVPMMVAKLEPVKGQVGVKVLVQLGKGITVRSDLDNFIKPILDALKPPSYGEDGKVSKLGSARIEEDNLEFVHEIFLRALPRAGKKTGESCIWVEVYSLGGKG